MAWLLQLLLNQTLIFYGKDQRFQWLSWVPAGRWMRNWSSTLPRVNLLCPAAPPSPASPGRTLSLQLPSNNRLGRIFAFRKLLWHSTLRPNLPSNDKLHMAFQIGPGGSPNHLALITDPHPPVSFFCYHSWSPQESNSSLIRFYYHSGEDV